VLATQRRIPCKMVLVQKIMYHASETKLRIEYNEIFHKKIILEKKVLKIPLPGYHQRAFGEKHHYIKPDPVSYFIGPH
jgi:hypothetical protein